MDAGRFNYDQIETKKAGNYASSLARSTQAQRC